MPAPATSAAEPKAVRIAAWLFLATTLAVNLWLVTRHWNESLIDGHPFRQIQTALTAHYFRQDGLKLAYETPILGAPWSIPMEFPTYQACVASVSRLTGWPLEQSGRLVAVFFFYAGLPALYLLLKRWRFPFSANLCSLAAMLTCPLYAFYSRTFMIESTALCFSLWFLLGFAQLLEEAPRRGLALVWVFGTLAALTKVTTFAVFCLPAAYIGLARVLVWSDTARRPVAIAWRKVLLAAVALALPLAAGAAWVRYSDYLKNQNPYAGFITSQSLREWNLGTWHQRTTLEFWRRIGANIAANIVGEPGCLLALGLIPLLGAGPRRRLLACVVFFAGGPLAFSNLYFVHDYYFYASAIFLLIGFGLVMGTLLGDARLPFPARLLLLGLAWGAQLLTFSRGYGLFYTRPNEPPPALAPVVRDTLPVDAVMAVLGLDWNGTLPYYSGRRAIMVPNDRVNDTAAFEKSLQALGSRRVGALVVAGNFRFLSSFIHPRLTQLGLAPYPIASSDDMDLYLRSDLHARATADLRLRRYPGVVLQLQPLGTPAVNQEDKSLESPDWQNRLAPITQPVPFRYRAQYTLSINPQGDHKIINMQAPTELHFHPPAHARHIVARGGLMPESYRNGNTTDGIVIQFFEESDTGTRRPLLERAINPLRYIADRVEAVITYDSDEDFKGDIIIRVDPGPLGDINYDWAYWREVRIY